MRAVYYQNDKELDSDVEKDLWVRGEEARLLQLLKILLDNGEKYSPPGGRTQVRLERLGTRKIRLMVANTGSRIPEEKKKEIFERFYPVRGLQRERSGLRPGTCHCKEYSGGASGKDLCRVLRRGKTVFM